MRDSLVLRKKKVLEIAENQKSAIFHKISASVRLALNCVLIRSNFRGVPQDSQIRLSD